MSSIFYNAERVKIGTTEVPNLQSVNLSHNVQRSTVGRLGHFAPEYGRHSLQDASWQMNVEFIPSGNDIETVLGLCGASGVTDHITRNHAKQWHEYYIESKDIINGGSDFATWHLTSGMITNYSFQAAVGQIGKANFSVDGLELKFDITGAIAAPTPTLGLPFRPQDIKVDLPTGIILGIPNETSFNDSLYIQNFSVNIPLPVAPVYQIGARQAIKRTLQTPVIATFQLTAIVSAFKATTDYDYATYGAGGITEHTTTDMNRYTCGTPIQDNVEVSIFQPTCTGVGTTLMTKFTFQKPHLDNISYSNTVGGYTSVELQFSCACGYDSNAGAGSNVYITPVDAT